MANASRLLGRGKEKVMVLYGTGITGKDKRMRYKM